MSIALKSAIKQTFKQAYITTSHTDKNDVKGKGRIFSRTLLFNAIFHSLETNISQSIFNEMRIEKSLLYYAKLSSKEVLCLALASKLAKSNDKVEVVAAWTLAKKLD